MPRTRRNKLVPQGTSRYTEVTQVFAVARALKANLNVHVREVNEEMNGSRHSLPSYQCLQPELLGHE